MIHSALGVAALGCASALSLWLSTAPRLRAGERAGWQVIALVAGVAFGFSATLLWASS